MLRDFLIGLPIGAGSVFLMYLVSEYLTPLVHA